MSRDVITVGSTMRILLLYQGEYSQWRERFMNHLEEQIDGEAMINSIQNGEHPLPVVTQVSLAETTSNVPPPLKDKSINNYAKELWDALERHMLGSEYGEQDWKAVVLYEYETFKATEGELLLDTYIRYLQYGTTMRQNKNLMEININALYNILKQDQGDVNEAMSHKKKVVVVTSDPLALVAEKTIVSKSREKVVIQSDSEGSDDEDISDLKKITALLAKAFNRKKYYVKPTNNNLRTSSASSSANKKPEYVKSEKKTEDKKVDEKKRDMSKVKCYNCKKNGHFAKDYKKAKDQAWMESSSDSDQEISANMVFMAKMEKVLSDSEENNDDDQEIFHDAIEPASENFNENHIVSQTDHDESEVDHNDSEEKDHLVDKLIKKFNQKIAKCQKHLDTLSSVRRPKYSGVIWKKKGSSNTSNVDLSSVSNSKLNKDVKRYSRKDLLSCNNSHHVDTRSAYACNDAMNVSCNSRLYASYDVNDLFVFDDVSIRNSRVSKMPFRKKPHDSLNVRSKSNSNNSLPRTLFRWLPKMQPLAEPVAKWIPKIVQICLWIIDSGCSKHMTGNRALLTNFVEKFLGTVRFGNNDFAVIAGYGDVVIGSMTIKKVYYVEGLGHNLFSVGQFCDKGLEVAFRKSTCFVRNEDGVDLLTGDRSSNLYTIAL
ncbi:retrovirus-related pol polyprotein from transposon TNT 1-94 [Tanacetum coccineum]